ncbi:MAG: hypothetical protein ACWA5T_07150 [Parvularcula sp.]
MKKAIVLSATSLVLLTAPALAQCSYKVGDTVSMQYGEALVERLQTYRESTAKSEFETTAEYEARRSKVSGELGPRRRTVVRGPFNLDYVYYNADESAFWVAGYAFDNWSPDWAEALPASILQMNKRFKPALVRGVGVQYRKLPPMGTSPARTISTALFRDYKGFSPYRVDLEWQFDGREVFPNAKPSKELTTWGDGYMPYSFFRVSVPRDTARIIKKDLRVAYEVTPREPFLYRSTEKVGNESDPDQVDLVAVYMHCGLITDGSNRVWGILRPTQP